MTDAEAHDRVRDGTAMLRGMSPVLNPGTFAFTTVAEAELPGLLSDTVAIVREAEGISVCLPCVSGRPLAMAWITLEVHSALDGVGLTAAVSAALAQAGIACNMVAAHHHDHAFVPASDAERALSILKDLSAAADPKQE